MTADDLDALATLLRANPSLELVGSLRVQARGARSSNAERQARFKARRRGVTEGVTEALPGNAETLRPPTTPSGGEGETPEAVQVAKSSELQKNPENQKKLSGSTPGRARGGRGNAGNVTVPRVTTPVTRWRFAPDDWSPTEAHRSLGRKLGVDFEDAEATFRAHEFQPPKSDPGRAFSNWLRSPHRKLIGRSNGRENPHAMALRWAEGGS